MAGLWKYVLSIGLLITQAVVQAETLQNIRPYEAPDHTRVVLDTIGAPDAKVYRLTAPERVVIDLYRARLATGFRPDFSRIDGKRVKNIRYAKRGDGYRVVLDLTGPLTLKEFVLAPIAPYGHRLVIDLFDREAKPAPPQRNKPNALRDIVIAIDAGHGGDDPGAIGVNRVYEKQVVLSMARKLGALFDKTPGYRVVMVRTGDYYIPLRQRTRIAHDARAHLFLSLHADAFKNSTVKGASIYMLSERGANSETARFLAAKENMSDLFGGVGDVSLGHRPPHLRETLTDLSMEGKRRQSSQIGQVVLNRLKRVTQLHKDQVDHAGFVVLKAPDIPSLLIETGFMSNPSEARRLNQAEHQGKIVRAIFDGVISYWKEHPPPGTALAQLADDRVAPTSARPSPG